MITTPSTDNSVNNNPDHTNASAPSFNSDATGREQSVRMWKAAYSENQELPRKQPEQANSEKPEPLNPTNDILASQNQDPHLNGQILDQADNASRQPHPPYIQMEGALRNIQKNGPQSDIAPSELNASNQSSAKKMTSGEKPDIEDKSLAHNQANTEYRHLPDLMGNWPLATPAPATDAKLATPAHQEVADLLQHFCNNLFVTEAGRADQGRVMLEIGASLPGAMVELVRNGAFLHVRLHATDRKTLQILERSRGGLIENLSDSTHLVVTVDAVSRDSQS